MKKLAIVGASGLVGQTVLKVLEEDKMLNEFELYLLTSDNSAGETINFVGRQYTYIKLDENCLNYNFSYVIFSAGDEISKAWVKKFIKRGAYVIDNSNAFRRGKNVPLVVPEINSSFINKENLLYANPNCSTIQLVVILDKIRCLSKINKVIVSSYQSVSGAGSKALNDLINKQNNYFAKPIYKNIFPYIGDILNNGVCKEEDKIMFETNKILKQKINCYATTVRVPIPYCHGESVYVELKDKITIDDFVNCLKCDYIKFVDENFCPSDCVGTNFTYISRIRKVGDKNFMFFIFADNLRRGAAYNAVKILKYLCIDD